MVQPQYTAKRVILGLLLAIPGGQASVEQILRGTAVMKVSENSVRVTLSRLVRDGLLHSPDRGIYQLGQHARELHYFVSRWRTRLDDLKPWTGNWWVLLTGDMARADPARRELATALDLLGYREIKRETFIRPANLHSEPAETLHHLQALGCLGDAILMDISDICGYVVDPGKLWRTNDLNDGYRLALDKLRNAKTRIDSAAVEQGAKIAFVAGADAIRTIVRDPLLPNDMVDAVSRKQLLTRMLAFDTLGHRLWRKVMQIQPVSAGVAT